MSVVRSVGLGLAGGAPPAPHLVALGIELKCTTTDTSEQVYRHEGRQQTVNYLGKCSCVALAVDAAVVLVHLNLIPRPGRLTDLLHVLLCHVPFWGYSNLIRYNNMLVGMEFISIIINGFNHRRGGVDNMWEGVV